MAYIVPGSVIKTPAGATGMTAQIAPWLTGDHTFIFVSSNATGVTTPSGYTIIGSYSRTTNIGGIWYAKKHTTDSSSGGSIALTIASGAATISTMNVRDVDASWLAGTLTSAVDYYTRGTTTALTFSCNAADLVTGSDDCLLLVGGAWNASNGQARCSTNDLTSLTLESNSSSVGMFTGFRQLGAASSNSPAITAYKDITGNSQMCLVAVKSAAGGARSPVCKPNFTELEWYGGFGKNNSGMNPTWLSSPSTDLPTGTWGTPAVAINATLLTATGTATVGASPWGTFSTLLSTLNTAGAWAAAYHASPVADLTDKILTVSIGTVSGSAVATIGSEGFILMLLTDQNNWVAYQVLHKNLFVSNGLFTVTINLGSATEYASDGAITWSSIAHIAWIVHRIGSAATSTGMYIRDLLIYGSAEILGGGSNYPATYKAVSGDVQGCFRLHGIMGFLRTYGKARHICPDQG